MTKPKYAGNGFFVLPAKDEEPYRLWHAFACAIRRQGDELHPDYAEWGDFENQDFRIWFDDSWKRLFSVGTGVALLEPGTVVPDDQGGRFMTVIIPMEGYIDSKVGYQLNMILKEHFTVDDKATKPMARWRITDNYDNGMVTALPAARRFLRLYNFWIDAVLELRGDTDAAFDMAVRAMNRWYDTQNKVAMNEIGELPDPYKRYDEYLDYKNGGGTKKADEWGHTEVSDNNGYKSFKLTAEDSRKSISRDLVRAKNISYNVKERRVFPGHYSDTSRIPKGQAELIRENERRLTRQLRSLK
ncbi:MAG: hypothetical protein CFE28_03875 [Alphaproteobacteria bacterium PA2]|nr:MAG: hypothetical protein CFE28_03875 [Alphaproteobacteria bacterium PA2]